MFEGLESKAESLPLRERRARQQAAFLDAIGPKGWYPALEAAGVDDEQIYRWLRRDPEFKAAYEDAKATTAVRLERIVDQIAAGEIDAAPAQVTLLQFRLKALRPEVYRDRASVQIDSTVTVAANGDGSRARMLLAEWTGGGGGGAAEPLALPAAAPR